MQFYTIEQIGPSRSLTPEGFLLCKSVPVARTGLQLYGPGETPIQMGAADVVRIERDPEEVFRDETVASINGKPIVNDHPTDADGQRTDVTPKNWRDLAVGHAMNARRGDAEFDNFLIADLLITDQDAIDLIQSGKRQISVGYDADYDEIEPGHGRQKNIIANHLAIVDAARCGPACAIGDSIADVSPLPRSEEMATKQSWTDKIFAALKSGDKKAFDEALEKTEDQEPEEEGKENGGVHVHLHQPNGKANGEDQGVELDPDQLKTAVSTIHALEEQMIAQGQENDEMWDALDSIAGGGGMRDAWPHRDARRARDGRKPRDQKEDKDDDKNDTEDGNRDQAGNKKILPGFEMEVPPGATDSLRRAHDSALLEDSFSQTVALAEILVPGIRLPTFDRAAAPRKTFDAMCAFRGKVLDLAYAQPDGRDLIDDVTGGRFASARGMPCERVRDIFFAAGSLKKRLNNNGGGTADQQLQFGGTAPPSGPIQTLADLQRSLDQHYANAKH